MSKTLALLRQAIESSGRSVRAIASELGMNHSHLSRILSGRVGIGTGTVGRLMGVFDPKTGLALLETFLREEREKALAYYEEALRKKRVESE